MSNNGANPMKPYPGKLAEVRDLATGIKLFRVELTDREGQVAFADYRPGQFAFLSAFGAGEAAFGIAGTPARGPILDFAVQALGHVTDTLHGLEAGDPVGVRGPMGNWFPMEDLRDRNVVILAGGMGGAPLRPVIQTILDNREDYGHLTILWAARNPGMLIFTDELEGWRNAWATDLHVTVDQGDEDWTGNVGLITQLLEKVNPSPQDAVTVTCGPPIMIHFVFMTLRKLGFTGEQMLTTLEARMHCGIGKCGRCNMGEKFICVDGPVFWQYEIAEFLEGFL
jgi:NAD(P)H-flavin reductase